jgi:hypothetical protein
MVLIKPMTLLVIAGSFYIIKLNSNLTKNPENITIGGWIFKNRIAKITKIKEASWERKLSILVKT